MLYETTHKVVILITENQRRHKDEHQFCCYCATEKKIQNQSFVLPVSCFLELFARVLKRENWEGQWSNTD